MEAIDAANSNPEPVRRTAENEEAFIVVTHVGDQQFGIVVDSVFDTEEIVVKPAASILRDITMFSGNTILGDGSVIMIVDPNGIAQSITSELSEASDKSLTPREEGSSGVDGEMSLLVFRAGSEEPKAVPLSLVTRLEEFDVADLEHSNNQSLIQYRGKTDAPSSMLLMTRRSNPRVASLCWSSPKMRDQSALLSMRLSTS